jgi:hypothetical protein
VDWGGSRAISAARGSGLQYKLKRYGSRFFQNNFNSFYYEELRIPNHFLIHRLSSS